MGTKYCTRCKKTKLLSEFNKNRSTKDGHSNWCKICNKEYRDKHRDEQAKYCRGYYERNREEIIDRSHRYYQENREDALQYERDHLEQRHNKYLQRTYGITLREYDLMLKLQGGVCAICGKTPEENGRRLAVDHDHETGEIRELLCIGCNNVLGNLNDNPEMCGLFRIYLQKHGK